MGSSNSFSAKCDAILAKCDAINLDRAFARCDADFKESDHPRDGDGKFGSGGGGGKSPAENSGDRVYKYAGPPDDGPSKSAKTAATPTSTSKPAAGKSKAPFVNEFMKGSKNRESDMSRLSALSDEKLKKALDLITSHRLNDEDSVYMKELIRDTLKSSK